MNEAFANLESVIKKRIEECERKGWSRHIGAGWTEGDIEKVEPCSERSFLIAYSDSYQRLKIEDLNLRELDAVRDWLFKRIGTKRVEIPDTAMFSEPKEAA